MGFLGNLVKVFPALATRPLHITGESYSGVWIVSQYLMCFEVITHPFCLALYHKGIFRNEESSSKHR